MISLKIPPTKLSNDMFFDNKIYKGSWYNPGMNYGNGRQMLMEKGFSTMEVDWSNFINGWGMDYR